MESKPRLVQRKKKESGISYCYKKSAYQLYGLSVSNPSSLLTVRRLVTTPLIFSLSKRFAGSKLSDTAGNYDILFVKINSTVDVLCPAASVSRQTTGMILKISASNGTTTSVGTTLY